MFLGRRLGRRSLGGGRSLGEGGYTAKTFSVYRQVHNYYTKRILNLTLNRKKNLRRKNETLDKLIRGKTAASRAAQEAYGCYA